MPNKKEDLVTVSAGSIEELIKKALFLYIILFAAGICEGFEKERTFDLKLDFLGDGEFKMTAFKDGVNANYQAMHYNKVEQKVNKNSTIKVTMMMNGGFAAVIE